ncbi:CoA-binding protein [Chloroflexota bacterium]
MPLVDYSRFNSLFCPRAMAMIGASDDLGGSIALSSALNHDFQGQFYLVNNRGGELRGYKVYNSVKDIPGPVDYVWIRVPAKATVQVIRDCIEKGVKLVTIYTAGFGESDNEWGAEVEQEVLEVACHSGIRLLGPNCMGVYCPASGLSYDDQFPAESGPVGMLSQSGGNTFQLIYSGDSRGMRFSKVISYGNAIDINEAELMEYYALDEETKIVVAYVEEPREGERFFRALKEAARIKPVIVLNGGQTEGGARAALSHTRSLAGSTAIWSSLIRQAGAIQADNIEECADIGLACLFMKPPQGRRTAVIGWGGGASVQAADDCYRNGLILPPMSQDIISDLRETIPTAGSIVRNPLDVTPLFMDPRDMDHAIRAVGQSPDVDVLLLSAGLQVGGCAALEMNILQPAVKAFISAARGIDKPAAVAIHAAYSPKSHQVFLELQDICARNRTAFYPSTTRAAIAIDKLVRYNEARQLDLQQ